MALTAGFVLLACSRSDERAETKAPERATDAGVTSSAVDDAATGKPSATGSAPTRSAPANSAPTVAVDPLSTFFAEPPDPQVTLLTMASVPYQPITVTLPVGWTASPYADYALPWRIFEDKHQHARIYLGIQLKAPALLESMVTLGTQHVGVTNATFGSLVSGHVGASRRPAKIARGTAKMHNQPAEIWYALIEYTDEDMLVMFASLRKDVYPKLEKEIHAVLRSLTFNK